MDASCKIQRSIHDVRLTYKYVSRILGTYQSKLAGRFFHHFAWLVEFTNSSQKISTQLLTVLTKRVILQLEQRKRDKEIRRLKKIS